MKPIKDTHFQEKQIIVTESTVIDLYKKLTNKQNIEQAEIEEVKNRFNELCNYKRI